MHIVRFLNGSAPCTASAIACAWLLSASAPALGGGGIPAGPEDFREPGTQPRQTEPPEPWMISDPILSFADGCAFCHYGFEDPATTVIPGRWRGSMHAHSFRDPIFQAAFAIAGQDLAGSTELCLRCHAPRGWLEGRATPPTGNPDGSDLFFADRDEGVTCATCHRMVDPVYKPGISPPDDELIIAALQAEGLLPLGFGNAQMVIDPMDVRRGPFDDVSPPHLWAYSPFHRSGDMCGACHDVSNPLFSRVGGPVPSPTDTYVLNDPFTPHPTSNKFDEFPEQRTYSEWLNSEFAQGGVDMKGRFGGNRTVVSSCQDCHMPAVTGQGCIDIFEPPVRNDLPYHSFAGANVAAVDMILHMFGPDGTKELDYNTVVMLQRQRQDVFQMLDRATDALLTQFAGELNVRIVNHSGHKLLTGMPEGRRIWKNVRFYSGKTLLAEHGAYDFNTGELSASDTKVYEQLLGIDAYMAAQTGLPVGPSFHLVFVNAIFKDNRIPPRGFTNAAFEAVQAGHVGYSYEDGQYWDDTPFCIPPGATRAEVKLYYQTASKEYMEFLRDTNTTDNRGLDAYNAWAAVVRGSPVVMDDVTINLAPFAPGDVTGDGLTSFGDITKVLANWGAVGVGIAGGDANCDGAVNFGDITFVLANWGASVR